MEIELNEKMYYACSQCSFGSKVQWHRPKTQRWHDHKKFIDLIETNSDRPQYFWCTLHNRPHAFQRNCLQYKAIITYNGNREKVNSPTSQLSHNDILLQIDDYVLKNSNSKNWKKAVHNSNSLPWPCDRETRLRAPDLIYCEPDKTLKFNYTITNIIEFETATTPEKIIEKIKDYNLSSNIMVQNCAQNEIDLPNVIFLYDKQTNIALESIRKAIITLDTEYLDDVIVEYHDNNNEWFKKYFKILGSLKNNFSNKAIKQLKNMNILKEEMKCVCPICRKTLKTEAGVVQHLRDTICGKGKIICPVCGKKFSKNNSLIQHIKYKKDRDENHSRLYRLNYSSNQNKSLHEIAGKKKNRIKTTKNFNKKCRDHKWKNVNEYQRICEICGKKRCNNHKWKNVNEYLDICELCGKEKCIKHKWKKSNEYLDVCEICGEQLRYSSGLYNWSPNSNL